MTPTSHVPLDRDGLEAVAELETLASLKGKMAVHMVHLPMEKVRLILGYIDSLRAATRLEHLSSSGGEANPLETVCPECDGHGLMHGFDADCPKCRATGHVDLESHVGRSIANDCWWVRFYPLASEEHAKALEERIRSVLSGAGTASPPDQNSELMERVK